MVLKPKGPVALTATEKAHLRKLGHGLDAIVQIGKNGLSDAVIDQLRTQFEAHELLKVKVAAKAAVEIEEVCQRLSATTGARLVQQIGRVLLLYRAHDDPDDRRIRLPKKKRTKPEADA